MFGREMRKKIFQLKTSVRSKEVVRDNDAEYKVRMKVNADRNASRSESKVEIGDTVVLKDENRSKSKCCRNGGTSRCGGRGSKTT